MAQAVVIKSNKYGIQLILDPEIPFEDLLEAVAAKFQESKKFFKDAQVAVAFEGRKLTQDESLQIIDAVTANSDLSIICIIDGERAAADMFRREISIFYDSVAGKDGDFYRGDLKPGQTLENDAGIILIGDVPEGAKLVSGEGYIIVMGALRGEACVHDGSKFITALEMSPRLLRIGEALSTYERVKDKKKRRRDKEAVKVEPQIAFVKGLTIQIEAVRGDMFGGER